MLTTGEHVHNLKILDISTANSLISCFTHLSTILNDVRCPDVPDLQGFHHYKGQLVLKSLFGFFNSLKKGTKNFFPSRLGTQPIVDIKCVKNV